MFAAVGILTGLYWRDALGDRGQVVDVSLLEACFALIAGWKRAHDGSESDARLNATDVVCGPIYSVADIVEDPHFRARDMLITHADLEFGECVGPGVVPKFWQTPGTIRWPGTWKEGSRNSDVHGHLLGLPAREPVALKREGVL